VLNAAGVEELAARKRLLVAECESHRRALNLELAEFQATVDATVHPLKSALSISRVLVMAAPLAGLVLGRAAGRSRGWLKMSLVGWQVFRRIQSAWAGFRKRRE